MRPYNWFCQVSNKCAKIYISDFMPSIEGNIDINIVLEAINYNNKLDFIVDGYDTITTVSERKVVVKYKVKNLSKKDINFRPKFSVTPEEFTKYIKRNDCLCFEDHEIEAGKEITLQFSFRIDSDIEEDPNFYNNENQSIRIGYYVN